MASLMKALALRIYSSSRERGHTHTHSHTRKHTHLLAFPRVPTFLLGAVSVKGARLLSQAPNKSQTVKRLRGKKGEVN